MKVPNSLVLTQPVSNYTRGRSLIWNEVRVDLELDSDWKRAESIAKQVLDQMSHSLNDKDYSEIRKSNEEMIFVRQEPSVSLQVQDGIVALQLRYLCKFYKRRQTTDRIWRELLDRFKDTPEIKLIQKKKQ